MAWFQLCFYPSPFQVHSVQTKAFVTTEGTVTLFGHGINHQSYIHCARHIRNTRGLCVVYF